MDMTSYLLGKNGNRSNYSDDVASYLLGKNASSGEEIPHHHGWGEEYADTTGATFDGHCAVYYRNCIDPDCPDRVGEQPYRKEVRQGEHYFYIEGGDAGVTSRTRGGVTRYTYTVTCMHCGSSKHMTTKEYPTEYVNNYNNLN